jgi:hypothetical protein
VRIAPPDAFEEPGAGHLELVAGVLRGKLRRRVHFRLAPGGELRCFELLVGDDLLSCQSPGALDLRVGELELRFGPVPICSCALEIRPRGPGTGLRFGPAASIEERRRLGLKGGEHRLVCRDPVARLELDPEHPSSERSGDDEPITYPGLAFFGQRHAQGRSLHDRNVGELGAGPKGPDEEQQEEGSARHANEVSLVLRRHCPASTSQTFSPAFVARAPQMVEDARPATETDAGVPEVR